MQEKELKVRTMAEIVSFRFRQHELEHIHQLSHEKKMDRTNAARELIEYGWTYYILRQYKEGKISLERTAEALHITLTELIDLLADMGIQSPLRYDDYLEGLKNIY